MSAPSPLRRLRVLLKQLIVTPSDLEAFLLDYFRDEVHSRSNFATADRTSIENLLLQVVSQERIIEALQDWAERNDQAFTWPESPGEDPVSGRLWGRAWRTPRSGLLDRVHAACELKERQNSSKGLSIRRITPRGTLCILQVSYSESGFPTSYALGVSEQPPTQDILNRFCEIVARQQLPAGFSLPSIVVYAGDKPSPELFSLAQGRNIQ